MKPASSVTFAPRISRPRASSPKSIRSGPSGVLVEPERVKSTINSSETPMKPSLLKLVSQFGESSSIVTPPIVKENVEAKPDPRLLIFNVRWSKSACGVVTLSPVKKSLNLTR